ncbi:MAG TPA: hypothetical protein PKX56_00905, partial [Marmoricola sp.]|nr:antibiotic biosynthesis monooxygenase [Marmoricola sp.]HNI70311.1 antibiotic biosynthesis monooxygenase [Marmoricola sp.]HNJ77885.1 hypothetical protein [Marmoricola sp.]
MLVVNRFRASGVLDFGHELETARDALSQCVGFQDGQVARNLDEPDLWCLVTRWADVGSYRRALSSYQVKLNVVPLLSRALDEPSAYEIAGAEPFNVQLPRELH